MVLYPFSFSLQERDVAIPISYYFTRYLAYCFSSSFNLLRFEFLCFVPNLLLI
jgi:hypothetical protein